MLKKNRPDGKYIKDINPYQKLMPHIMPHRYDAQNMCKVDIVCDPIDEFIKEQYQQGKRYSYMDIMLATIVRLFAQRPSLNRFVMNRRIYQHNDITISFTVKKVLRDDSEDTTVKLHFTGTETLDEVKNKVEEVVKANTGKEVYNSVDKTAKFLTNAPHWVISMFVSILSWLDKHNWLPASLIEISPFHNSAFITFMKSIKGDYIYHHCYEFGTTGIFIGMGKERSEPVVQCGEVKVQRIMNLGMVLDERFCDGLYFVNSMRAMKAILKNPACLLEEYKLPEEQHQHGVRSKETKEHYKQIARQQRRQRKEQRKQDRLLSKKSAKMDDN